MSTLFPKTISYLRKSGAYVKGIWTEGSSIPSTFTGSVQLVTGKDLEMVPVGRRDKGLVKIYSNSPLNVSQEGADTPGDIVIWAGKQWEVFQEISYGNSLIEHYKYMAQFIGVNE